MGDAVIIRLVVVEVRTGIKSDVLVLDRLIEVFQKTLVGPSLV